MRRYPLLPLALGACALANVLLAAVPASRPNVVLILTDDQGYGDLRCHGNPMIRTPNLDRLFGESVRLTNYHVDPTCAPTRAALMTGRYSTRGGVWHTVMGRSLLYRDEVTLAELFRRAGYRTAMFGKWHLGDNYPYRPQDRGFDETLMLGGGGIGQTPDHWGNTYFDDTYLRNGRPEKFSGYCTDVFFQAADDFMRARRDEPFFVYLATNVPHSPYNVAEKYRAACAARGVPAPMDKFYGMIEELDENVGRLLTHLEKEGLAENTIVIWTTDNGTAAGYPEGHGTTPKPGEWPGFNAGMRGAKNSAYDGGHRVPCFVRWPAGGVGGGRDVPALSAHFDWLPTLADLCGLTLPAGRELDGRSLAPWLRGQRASWPERTLFVHRQRREIPPKWIDSAVLTDEWRLVNGRELYAIAADVGQTRDVAAAHPKIVADLRARYESWWQSLQPAIGRYACLLVGDSHENPTIINCMDWHNPEVREIPFAQKLVQAMPWSNGFWMIEVAQAGRYSFTLRHQPAIAPRPLEATRARVHVGDTEASAAVVPGSAEVTLTLDLPAGPAKLETWLEDEASGKARGAFFVEIRRIE